MINDKPIPKISIEQNDWQKLNEALIRPIDFVELQRDEHAKEIENKYFLVQQILSCIQPR